MTTKQELFIQKYLENGYNATRAYMDIYPGKTEKVATAASSRLLTNVNIKDLIDKYKKELADKSNIKKEDMLNHLMDILDNNKNDNPRAALGAIELITRMLGYNAPTKTENTHTVKEQPLFTYIEEIKPKEIK